MTICINRFNIREKFRLQDLENKSEERRDYEDIGDKNSETDEFTGLISNIENIDSNTSNKEK